MQKFIGHSPFSLMLIPSVTFKASVRLVFFKGATESLIQFLRQGATIALCENFKKAVGLLKKTNKPVALQNSIIH
jgi:hypothetical protein